MDTRGTTDWIGDYRLRLRDVPFRRATLRGAFTLPLSRGSQLVPSHEAFGSFLRAGCRRRACFRRGYPRRGSHLPGSVGRSLVSNMDRISRGWNPRRRTASAPCDYGNHLVYGTAHTAMVLGTRAVHYWTRGNGGVGASAAEFISIPRDLDIAALDPCYGTGVANTVCGVSSNGGHRSPIAAQLECAAMGCRAVAHVVIARVASRF